MTEHSKPGHTHAATSTTERHVDKVKEKQGTGALPPKHKARAKAREKLATGLTVREHFIGCALTGALSGDPNTLSGDARAIAEKCVKYVDGVIEFLAEEEDEAAHG